MALKTGCVRFADAGETRARQNAGQHDFCGARLDSLDRHSYYRLKADAVRSAGLNLQNPSSDSRPIAPGGGAADRG
jgi:hypothetical protein